MKKVLSIILLICVVFSLTGCALVMETVRQPYESYFLHKVSDIRYGNELPEINLSHMYQYYPEPYVNQYIKSKRTIKFDSVKYKGEYLRTESFYSVDSYICEGGVKFTVKHKTSKLVGINFHDAVLAKRAAEGVPNLQITEAQAIEMAKEYAKAFKSDLDDFRLSTNLFDCGCKEISPYYEVFFTKYISGIRTSEQISVDITTSGELISINAYDIGAFDDIKKVSTKKVDKSIEKAAAEYCKKTWGDEENIEFKLTPCAGNSTIKIVDGYAGVDGSVRIYTPDSSSNGKLYDVFTVLAYVGE